MMTSSSNLTSREKEIIRSVYKFRFLDSSQIQHLLGHKSRSRVKAWLVKLSTEEYLQRHYKKTWGENRNPTIYFLGKKSAPLVSQNSKFKNPHIKHLDREEKISLTTANHFMSCANFYLKLRDFAESEGTTLEYYTETDIYGSLYHKLLKPSAYFLYKTEEETRSYFVIVDLETATRATIRRKIGRYIDCYQNGYWKNDFGVFPEVMIACLTGKRKQETLLDIAYQMKFNPGTEINFKVTTFNLIEENKSNLDVLPVPKTQPKQ